MWEQIDDRLSEARVATVHRVYVDEADPDATSGTQQQKSVGTHSCVPGEATIVQMKLDGPASDAVDRLSMADVALSIRSSELNDVGHSRKGGPVAADTRKHVDRKRRQRFSRGAASPSR